MAQAHPLTQAQSNLPINAILNDVLASLKTHNQLIIQAPPGAGKSTYLPLKLLEHSPVNSKIIMLEPRRLAAKSIATYVAKQLGEPVGQSVGYRIRGENKTKASTRLEVVTEGILTRMIQADPELSGVGMIIFDEFHERSIHADFGLALSLEVQQAFNEDLKLVVMSATLEQSGLQKVMPEAITHTSEGRGFAIEQRYAPVRANQSLIQLVCQQVEKAVHHEHGSILVFLPSIGLINACLDILKNRVAETNLEYLPLHGSLDFSAQQHAIAASEGGKRKVVLATNIAETSLTIEGVRIVIDSGLENRTSFDLASGVTRLDQKWVSQSSAVQRAGRAGRIEEGICVRLYSESQFKQSPSHIPPELLRSDLAPMVLESILWGTSNPRDLMLVDPPTQVAVDAARTLLQKLSLLTSDLTLTQRGERALHLGLEPRLSAMLLRADTALLPTALASAVVLEEPMRNSDELSLQVALLQDRRHPKQTLLIKRAQTLAKRLGASFNMNEIQPSDVGLCLSFAFPDRVGLKRQGQQNTYKLASGHGVFVDEDSRLSNADWIVAANLQKGRQSHSRVFGGAAISMAKLEAFHRIEQRKVVEWNEEKQAMQAEHQTRFGEIVLTRRNTKVCDLPADVLVQGVLAHIRRRGLDVLPWSKEARNLLERVNCARDWLPEHEWPNWSERALLESLDVWLTPYLEGVTSVKELQRLNMLEMMNSLLGWPLNQNIDKWLPKAYKVPSGSNKSIDYHYGYPPKISVKLQEMFGEPHSPTIAQGRVKITLELLSPAQRPLQITQDLAGFWNGAYKEVQKEMKGRYPKHPWPDEPATHQATSKTKRQLNR